MKNNYVAEEFIVGSLLHEGGLENRMPKYLERGIGIDHFESSNCKRIWKRLEQSYREGRMQDGLNLDVTVARSGISDAKMLAAGVYEIRRAFQGDSYIEQNLSDIEKLTSEISGVNSTVKLMKT